MLKRSSCHGPLVEEMAGRFVGRERPGHETASQPGHESTSEPLLVQRAKAGDRQAFAELVRMHQGVVRAYLSARVRGAEVVEDLAQEAFVRAYCGLSSFELPESGRTRPWLLGIARNLVLEYFRGKRRLGTYRGRPLEEALDLLHDQNARDDEEPIRREQRFEALRDCLEKLRPAASRLVARYYFERWSLSSLALEHNQREGAIRMKLFRIREALRACIERALSAVGGRA
jgi:RNA polymerase sigma-70 factor, ECF subfamily